MYGSKHDICDFAKHLDEVSLNELLDGSCKHPKSVKDKEKETEIVNGSILVSVRQACSILQLQKPTQTPNVAAIDGTYNHNASSCLPNSVTSGASTNDENKGGAADPPSSDKVSNVYICVCVNFISVERGLSLLQEMQSQQHLD